MKKYYRKLVRDKIPQVIEKRGGTYKVRVLPQREFAKALRKKLREETKEATTAPAHLLVDELADMLECMQSLAAFYHLPWIDITKKQKQKRKERGGFEKRLYLIWSADK